jgi:CTP:molybdopterin cytidylyltransferase MocA
MAAGLSRRMGAEKTLLPLAGATVLETVLGSLSRAEVRPVVVVVRRDLERGRLLAERAGALVVENPHPEAELLSSIRLGIAALDAAIDAFFLWPADHPLVAVETLRRLLAAGSPQTAALPTFQGRRGHPPLVGSALRPEIQSGTLEGGLRRLWRERAGCVREVEVDDEGVILDLNTPEQYARALARLRPVPPAV